MSLIHDDAHRVIAQAEREDWLTIEYVADHLAVSRRQVRRWLRDGCFGEVLILGHRTRRISRAAYKAFVEARTAA